MLCKSILVIFKIVLQKHSCYLQNMPKKIPSITAIYPPPRQGAPTPLRQDTSPRWDMKVNIQSYFFNLFFQHFGRINSSSANNKPNWTLSRKNHLTGSFKAAAILSALVTNKSGCWSSSTQIFHFILLSTLHRHSPLYPPESSPLSFSTDLLLYPSLTFLTSLFKDSLSLYPQTRRGRPRW